MPNITLRTTVTSLEVTGGGYNAVDVEIDGLDTDDVFHEVSVQDAIDAYGEDTVLDSIGEEAVREHFGIKEGTE
jgi:hypothetical protein